MTNGQIAAFVVALVLLVTVLVVGYAPRNEPEPTFTPQTVAPAVTYEDKP